MTDISRREFLHGAGILSAGIIVNSLPGMALGRLDINRQDRNEPEPVTNPINLIIDPDVDERLKILLETKVGQMCTHLSQFSQFRNATLPVNIVGYASDEFVRSHYDSYQGFINSNDMDYFRKHTITVEEDEREIAVNMSKELMEPFMNDENALSIFYGARVFGLTGVMHELGLVLTNSFGRMDCPYWFKESFATLAAFFCTNDHATQIISQAPTRLSGGSEAWFSYLENRVNTINQGIPGRISAFIAGCQLISFTGKETIEPHLQILSDMKEGKTFDEALFGQINMTKEEFYTIVEGMIRNNNSQQPQPQEPLNLDLDNPARV